MGAPKKKENKKREKLVSTKEQEVQKDLEAWAANNELLQRMERIHVKIWISRLRSHRAVTDEITPQDWHKILRMRCWSQNQRNFLNSVKSSGNTPFDGEIFWRSDVPKPSTFNSVFTRRRLLYRFMSVERVLGEKDPELWDCHRHWKLYIVSV